MHPIELCPFASTLFEYSVFAHNPISTDSTTLYISPGNKSKSTASTPDPASMSRDLPLTVRFSSLILTSASPSLVARYLYSISTKQSYFPKQFLKLASSKAPKESKSVSPDPLQVVSISIRCAVAPSGDSTNTKSCTGSALPLVTTQISPPSVSVFATELLPPGSLSGDTTISAIGGSAPESWHDSNPPFPTLVELQT